MLKNRIKFTSLFLAFVIAISALCGISNTAFAANKKNVTKTETIYVYETERRIEKEKKKCKMVNAVGSYMYNITFYADYYYNRAYQVKYKCKVKRTYDNNNKVIKETVVSKQRISTELKHSYFSHVENIRKVKTKKRETIIERPVITKIKKIKVSNTLIEIKYTIKAKINVKGVNVNLPLPGTYSEYLRLDYTNEKRYKWTSGITGITTEGTYTVK